MLVEPRARVMALPFVRAVIVCCLSPFPQETGAILADGTGTAPSADNSSCIFGPEFPLPKKKPVESEGVPSRESSTDFCLSRFLFQLPPNLPPTKPS